MIRTSLVGHPVIWQSDNTYSLPSYTGTVQWNGVMKKFQVSNGVGWTDIDNHIQYNVDSKLEEIIKWATAKMQEEKLADELRKKYPALDDAYNHLESVKALVSNN